MLNFKQEVLATRPDQADDRRSWLWEEVILDLAEEIDPNWRRR